MPSAESTVTPRRRRLRRPRNADPNASTRVDILKSAAKAFRRVGYHGATVEQIAAALQMKKGNLYYYFRNKEEILFACHQYSLDRLHELLDQVETSGLPPPAVPAHGPPAPGGAIRTAGTALALTGMLLLLVAVLLAWMERLGPDRQ